MAYESVPQGSNLPEFFARLAVKYLLEFHDDRMVLRWCFGPLGERQQPTVKDAAAPALAPQNYCMQPNRRKNDKIHPYERIKTLVWLPAS